MIYGRCGQEVVIVRKALLSDIKSFEKRQPNAADRKAIQDGSYVIIEDGMTERLYHLASLKADRGSLEISEAIAVAEIRNKFPVMPTHHLSNSPKGHPLTDCYKPSIHKTKKKP